MWEETIRGGSGSGSVYILDGTDDWSELAKISADDGAAGDGFGTSVSISGTTLFVGSPGDDDGGSASGSAYLYHQDVDDPSSWIEIEKIAASDEAADDEFGEFVSVSEDLAVVGARLNDDDGSGSGSAYVYCDIDPCPADLDDDDGVGFSDLLTLLVEWGETDSVADLNFDDDVDFQDLLILLDGWGPCGMCPSAPEADECADKTLGEDCECMDTLLDDIENGSAAESANARCWLSHYITCHGAQGCNNPPNCPDDDPCSGDHDPY